MVPTVGNAALLDLSMNKNVSVLSSRRELWKLTIMHGTVERLCCPVLFSVWKIKMSNRTSNWSNLPQRSTRPKLEKRTKHSLHIHDWDHFPSLWEKISRLPSNIISIFLVIPTNATKKDGSYSLKRQDRKDSDEIKWEKCSQDYFRRHMEKIFKFIF